jgi:Flp pilus assembly protein TadD
MKRGASSHDVMPILPPFRTLAALAVALVPVLALAQSEDVARSDEFFAEGVALHQSGDLIGAIDAYERALGITPWRLDARSNLGAALVRLGRYDEAVGEYRKALETDPGQVVIRFNLGLALYKSAQVEGAAREFQEVLDRDPSQRAARLLLADCQLQMGHSARAIDLLAPVESEMADDRLFAYLYGTALIREDEPERGQRMIDVLFRDGETAEGHLLLGAQHLRNEDYHGALPELQRAVELNPELHGAQSLLGIALMNTGDRPGADAAFRRELETNPNDFEANLRLGLLLRDEDRLDEAMDYLRRAEHLRPDHPDVLYGLARLHIAWDQLDQAEKLLRQLTETTPDFESGHVLLANVYYRQDKRELAEREREKVEELRARRKAQEPPIPAGPATSGERRPEEGGR